MYNTNVSAFLKCINSIKQINVFDYEIIVVNDGSNPEYTKSYEQLLKKQKDIKYYYKENGGVSSARNYGISKAIGKYMMTLLLAKM